MKSTFTKLSVATLLAFSLSPVNAATINFTLSGTVNNTTQNTWFYNANVFGLSIGNTITATASFDDSLLALNTSIDFANPNISMLITVGNTVYTDADEFFGGARLDLGDGFFNDEIAFSYNSQTFWFEGLRFSEVFGVENFDSSSLCCDFSGDDFDGTWDTVSVSSVSAVPVPAAAWLFGSGLLGLVGIARRKAA